MFFWHRSQTGSASFTNGTIHAAGRSQYAKQHVFGTHACPRS
jgi:hypothetical protein